MSQVAIIGAGVAGLLCARDLNRLGIACTVFEKSRGLGGRLARRQHVWGELDIGAPFLTVQTPLPEWGQLEGQGLLVVRRFSACRWQDGAVQTLPDQQHYLVAPSNNGLCHYLAEGLDIRRACRVASVEGGKLIDEHQQFLGDFAGVVLAAPAPQSQALLPAASSLNIDCHWQPGWTLLLQFDAPLDLPDIVEFVGHPLFQRLVHLSSLPGRDHRACYSLQLLPAACEALQAKDLEATLLPCLEALGQLVHLPVLLHCDRQRWQLVSGQRMQMPDAARIDEKQRIVLAGDWCSGGGVEGAWHSAGLAVAQLSQWQSACH